MSSVCVGDERSTPAWAGPTGPQPPPQCCRAEHPRVGGAVGINHPRTHRMLGAPPRRRGRLNTSRETEAAHRSTPRVGGDDARPENTINAHDGAPPRERGRRSLRAAHKSHLRSTPARAGPTSWVCPTWACSMEHPRVGGDDGHIVNQALHHMGAPPRGRGRPVAAQRIGGAVRSTPAWAGTTGGGRRQSGCRGEHPRVGGDDVVFSASRAPMLGAPPRGQGRHNWSPR